MGKVGVGGIEEPLRGRELFVRFFREASEKLRLERLRLRSWSGCSSEPLAKLVVTLCPLVRVTATWVVALTIKTNVQIHQDEKV